MSEEQQEFDFKEQEDGTFSGSQEEIAPEDVKELMDNISSSMQKMEDLIDSFNPEQTMEQIVEARTLVTEVERIIKDLQ